MAEVELAPARWRTWWSRPVGRVLDHIVYRTTVGGRRNVPAYGPLIFAANHLSYLDGPVMVGAAPRYMHVLVKREMFVGFLGRVLRASGQIPVDRSGDRRALLRAMAVLKRGGCVGILPEGKRGSGNAESVNSGVAWLALNSGAAVVPVAILGTRITGDHRNKIPAPGRRLQVVFGTPLTIGREPAVSGRVSMDRAAEQIRLRLAAHVQAAIATTGQQLPADESPASGERTISGDDPAHQPSTADGDPTEQHEGK
ncbi:1-acyl-sn-glycerol-3-phosphate acyltransferase [Paenarthrobacter sp. Z7-10]|uniref:lysophospholipid acyltransferase family protein n=1 Tax=Paenarthrobacter sp. Z7-10 TaxID=2787635 RepID=UPI0022A9C9CF|nr:lysophospholipid acyltransferase family protein [Paenarthrobacter sp. Z7-10]MCZ2403479.1 1-acyl-sn-glycerol-3-phosphate acyltransferase [Paenarthrobacter sp. Z7-10]